MNANAISQLQDHELSRELTALAANDSARTSTLLAYMGEFDARKLFARAGYASMYVYCVRVLHFSEDVAYKRIRAARAGRRFPGILWAIGEGRLHVSGVVLLKPHLTRRNVDELIAAATHKTRKEIELVLAERFPRPDLPAQVQALPAQSPIPAAAALSLTSATAVTNNDNKTSGSNRDAELAPGPVDSGASPSRVAPLAPRRFALQVTIGQSAHDKLAELQDLLGSAYDLERALEYALDAGVARARKSRFAVTDQPKAPRRRLSKNPRHIPANVIRAVFERDGGQCTYQSASGHRCTERRNLEIHHVIEIARGGTSTVDNLRLLCRNHNQYEAECAFGAAYMEKRRRDAKTRNRGQLNEDASYSDDAGAESNDALCQGPDIALIQAAKAREVIRYLQGLASGQSSP